jgi:hypothetical protein
MSFINYILLGLFWIIVCIGLGVYINARGFKGKNHHVIGLTSIFIFYIVGIFMLFAIIVFS